MASQEKTVTNNSTEHQNTLVSLTAKYEELERKFTAISAAITQKPAEGEEMSKDDDISSTTTEHGDEEKKKENLSSNPRARILVNKVDPTTGERVETTPQKKSDKDKDVKNRAFTLRKMTYGDRGNSRDNYSEIDVHDDDLWNLLQSKLRYYPYHLFQGKPTTLTSPFEALIHKWDDLDELAAEEVTGETAARSRSDLKLLMDTILAGSGDETLDRYLKSRKAAKSQETVTFESLWTLFPPGELVYGKPFQGQHEVFLVQDNPYAWPHSSIGRQDSSWKLDCWAYDWDGKVFSRSSLRLKFEPFEGQKSIVSLPFYPLTFFPENRKEMETNLIKRGKKFRNLCTVKEGSQMFTYKGSAVLGRKGFVMTGSDDNDDETRSHSTYDIFAPSLRYSSSFGPPESFKPPTKSTDVDSRVMVDFLSYKSYGPSEGNQVGNLLPSQDLDECKCEECKQNSGLAALYRTEFDDKERQKYEWDDLQYILCPPRVLGYILRDKQWAQLQVDHVGEIENKDCSEAWHSKLQLADEHGDKKKSKTKEMLLNLVKSHATTNTGEKSDLEVDDIIARKGKGLVILLYGPPGVGKTSTAETLALATRKPLFSISVADVGTKAKNAEANLAKIFDLASSWQAILLIDEADVFLESRQRGAGSSVDKNALVSVFLRVLEYYQGILILTTNQIAQFDVAVQSRVHIAIEYVSLNRSQKERIFDGFLKPLDQKGLIESYEDIKSWLEETVYDSSLDGRQIRNIVTSGLGLARAMGDSRLKKSHLQPVFKNADTFKRAYEKEFEKYVTNQNKMIK